MIEEVIPAKPEETLRREVRIMLLSGDLREGKGQAELKSDLVISEEDGVKVFSDDPKLKRHDTLSIEKMILGGDERALGMLALAKEISDDLYNGNLDEYLV